MKLVDAYWEKKNIGETTVEVIIEEADNISEIEESIQSIIADYQVAKVPVNSFEYYNLLQKMGFTFVETMVTCVRDMRPVVIPSNREELNKRLRLKEMDEREFDKMQHAVANGLYYTDRLSIDPHFSMAQSSNRYMNWLKQEWENGNEFYCLMDDDKYVGYLDLKKNDEKSYTDMMTGIFPEYRGNGYAMGFTSKLIDMLRERGAEKVYGDISTNNMPSLQSRLRYGYNIDHMNYIFVKHAGERAEG